LTDPPRWYIQRRGNDREPGDDRSMGTPRVEVDQVTCIGSANCVEIAEGVFRLNDEEKAEVVDPTAQDIETLRKAEEQCPVAAILVEEQDSDE
jgi:ferredoxin